MKVAMFPGSFDPITLGHLDIIQRALPVFDKLYIAIGQNTQKKTLFEIDQRLEWLRSVCKDDNKLEIGLYEGLTVKYAKEIGAKYLIRGLRNASDFDYEKTISQLNSIIGDGLETVFFISKPEYSHISSTIVREIIKGRGDVSAFVPKTIYTDIESKYYT
ncbi:MAG: pantetheine-phosphate adenylyltransferase [Saprospiraceae bacterium]|jgi:pantetheine-phosphate adenylyltransferase